MPAEAGVAVQWVQSWFLHLFTTSWQTIVETDCFDWCRTHKPESAIDVVQDCTWLYYGDSIIVYPFPLSYKYDRISTAIALTRFIISEIAQCFYFCSWDIVADVTQCRAGAGMTSSGIRANQIVPNNGKESVEGEYIQSSLWFAITFLSTLNQTFLFYLPLSCSIRPFQWINM